MSLKNFRAFGARNAIPLQAVALVLTLLHVVLWLPLLAYILNKLDDLSRFTPLGGLSWWPWLLLFGSCGSNLALWVILKLWDADLNDRSMED